MGRGKEFRGRKSHDQYAREALSPVRRSLLTLFKAIEFHVGKDGLTRFIMEYGGAYGLTPDTVSYTHLDVYKRQVITLRFSNTSCIVNSLKRLLNLRINHRCV